MFKKQLTKGALISYFAIALNILAGLLYTPWMIEKIGQSQYGLYTLANSLITLFLVDLGLSSATSRYLSRYHALGQEEKANQFLGMIYKLYLIIDAVILAALVLVFFMLDKIYTNLLPQELHQFKVIYVIAASFSVVNFPFVTLNGILTAYEQFFQLKLADVLYRVLVVVLMVAALWLGLGLYALVTVNAAVGLAVTAYKLFIVRRSTPVKPDFRYSDRSLYKEIFGFSFWSTVVALSQRLIFNITPSILGVVSNSAAIAVFGVVTTIEGYSFTLSSAVNGMFIPRISRIYTQPEPQKQMLPLLLNVGRFQYALNGLIVAGFAVIGRDFVRLWMGDAFWEAYYGILLVIIPGLFFNSLQIGNTAIVLTKQVKWYAWINLGMGLVNVTLSAVLSSYFGVIGACASIFVAYMLRAVALNILYQKKLHVDMKAFANGCYLRMSVPMLLTIAGGFWMDSLLKGSGWGWLALKAALVTVLYAAMIFLFGVRDKKALVRKLRSLLSGSDAGRG